MKTIKFSAIFLMIAWMLGACSEDLASTTDGLGTTESELTNSILNSNLTAVSVSALPASAQTVLQQEYANALITQVQASSKGYVVTVRDGDLSNLGETYTAFFDVNGRQMSRDHGKKGKHKVHRDKKKCYTYEFPITVTMPDESTITGESDSALKDSIKAWYKENPSIKDAPKLVYPINAILLDGTVVTINTQEEMDALREACKIDPAKLDKFYTLVFPVTITFPDATTYTAANASDLRAATITWYAANPGVTDKPTFVFPIQVTLRDGSILTIANQEELDDLRDNHKGNYGKKKGHHKDKGDDDHDDCFSLQFPISLTMPDGSVINGTSKDELHDAVHAWYDAHPDVTTKPMLVYPVTLVFEDGSTLVVNNDTELEAQKDNCD